jgi:sporulation protein YlmC with PRC-barrel domain
MLTNAENLKGLAIHATDGNIGKVEDFYFDSESWAIRYLVVETGGWLGGRRILITPYSVLGVDWSSRRLNVSLTKRQVENSPDIDATKPVTRQQEAEYLNYYEYPYYWGGPYLWGQAFAPTPALLTNASPRTIVERVLTETAESHLRGSEAGTEYDIEAADGEIGHMDSFIFEDHSWAIRYIEVATRNWWPGKKVLFSAAWVERISWRDSKFFVRLTRAAISSAPEYFGSALITREYEHALYRHYGQPPYWTKEENREALVISAV